jgi:diguanylate cyclase (GGDEF)-like protein/PAS domain S-box-containing protein
MQERNYTPLAALFLRRFLALYVAFSLLGLAAMSVLEYQRQRARVVDELHALATTFGPVLGHAVWDFQDTAVSAIVHGIAQDPDVVEVRLPAAPGFASRREASPAGGTPSDEVRVEAPLTIAGESGTTQRVGTLVIASSEAVIWRHVAMGLATTAAVTGGVLLPGALALWILVRRQLVDPLTRLSSQLQNELRLTDGLARRLPRFEGREFAVLRLRFILLMRQVFQAQAGLRKSHAELESRVAERTLYLSQVLDFNAEIIRNSPVPMGVYASSGDCVAANDAYAQLVGAKVEDLLAQNFITDPAWHKSPLQSVYATALGTHQPQQGELRVRTSFGKDLWCEYRVLPTQLSGQDHLLVQFTDLTERRRLEEELRQMAFQDALTQLPNRRLLLDRLEQAIRGSRRHGNRLAVIFIDLNKFKQLNDTFGHDVGDKLLVVVADRLQAMVRGSDTVARLGGDEFVVLSTELGQAAEDARRNAQLIADKIRTTLSEPCLIDGVQHPCSASVGLRVIGDGDGDGDGDAEAVLKLADAAMYEDKKARRNGPIVERR